MACVGTRGKLCYTAGETVSIDCVHTDSSGNVKDLTGTTITAQLLLSTASTAQAIDWTVTAIDLAAGSFNLSLTKVQSQTLLPIPTTPSEATTVKYITDIKVEYADTTVDFIGGLDIDIEQNAIR
jgi:hypothetical protein